MGLGILMFGWWDKATLGTHWFTIRKGERVGSDSFGNRYYHEKGRPEKMGPHWDRRKRWVIYAGHAEASAVPPEWNAWLQHTAEDVPTGDVPDYPWEKDHVPNLTGTSGAYRPPGNLSGRGRDRATGDYEAWRPDA